MKKNNNKATNSTIEMGNLFKIILIILIVFGIFYVITYYMQKNDKIESNNPQNTFTSIQYDEILMGSILNQNENEYYVLLVKTEDYKNRYKEYLSKYNNENKFYYSIIDNGLNKQYVGEESNLNVADIKDFKVNKTSLLKINSGKIVETYENDSEVMQKIIDINK